MESVKKKLVIKLEKQSWFQSLKEDCEAIMTEGIWNYRETLIKTYHLLGKRILQEKENFNRAKIYGEEIVKHIALSLNKSPRTLWQAVRFAEKFPDLNKLPGGKNISWHKICSLYLPDKKKEHICQWETIQRCKICRKIKL